MTKLPFVQVLQPSVGDSDWGAYITGDSVFNTAGTSLALQTATIMKTELDNIVLEVERAQLQQGKVDCGLYAIVFATEFCYGNNPE